MLQKIAVLALLLALASGIASAQEARGAITGRVTDPSGAVIPNATIVVTNTKTNETRRTATNETGYYEANFLEPSSYTVMAEAQGFKRALRSGLTVNVSARLEINLTLEIGQVAETVEVTAEAPLLETTTASGGRILDNKQLINLPFSDMNPFALSALAPGMQWTGQPEYRRPFDNAGTSSFNTMGGVGQNEYTIDGMTVVGSGRRVAFVPPSGSITEFKLETSNFDASQGFTSGASINVVSKSGTNRLTGAVYNQHWQQRWNATGFFRREQFLAAERAGTLKPGEQRQATGRSNNYEMTASGPVWIPKLFNGKDKLFWTITWNGIKQSKAESTSSVNRTVPTAAMRQGDFSELLNAPNGAARFTIFDPRSARLDGNTVVRTPFPGNKGVPILNPMYASYVKLYPTPNNVPGLVTPEQTLNYLAFAMPKDEKFNSIVNRYDWVIGQNHRLNARWQWNDRLADEYDWTYETERGLHTNGLTRINRGGNVGYLWTLSASNILDLNYGISRWEEGSRAFAQTKYKPSQVGLPSYLDQRAGAYHTLPRLDFSDNNYEDVSGGYPAIGTKLTTHELRATMTTIRGSHSFKYGWQERRHFFAQSGPGYSAGSFSWRNSWTRSTNVDNVAGIQGHEWAAFMMGLASGMSIDTNDTFYWRTPRRALFFQDDWRLTSRFRLSLGLRYEREAGTDESFNRGISRVFLADARSPISDMVERAYAANPLPEVPAAQFKVNGMTTYLGQNGYDTATKGTHILLPKFGATYSLNNKTVIRGGWAMYMDTYNVSNDRLDTNGYNQATSTPVSNDAGITFCCGVGAAANIAQGKTPVNDPFPVRADGSRFDEPYQNRLGGIARFGQDFGSLPWNARPALQHRWRIGFQRELAHNLVLDVSYNGAYSYLPVGRRINFLPEQYWTKGMARDQAKDNYLNANVPNPFNLRNLSGLQSSDATLYRYISGQGFFTNANIARHRILRGYPQYNNLTGLSRPGETDWKANQGYVSYHDLQILLERRFTRGFTGTFMYTRAQSYEADFMYNEFDTLPSERPADQVRPHRIALSSVWETPFGKGRTYIREGLGAWLLGNWNLSGVLQMQSGPALNWGNRFFYGDINQLGSLFKSSETRSKDLLQWFDPSIAWRGSTAPPSGFVGFEGRAAAQPGSYHVRMFPTRTDSLREDGIFTIDLKVERVFPIVPDRGIQARFSVDFLNATNHTNFGGPNTDPTSGNFGRVTSQRGFGRVIQFNLRVEF
jgi:hypothetical protein